jgi:hypothetical protein
VPYADLEPFRRRCQTDEDSVWHCGAPIGKRTAASLSSWHRKYLAVGTTVHGDRRDRLGIMKDVTYYAGKQLLKVLNWSGTLIVRKSEGLVRLQGIHTSPRDPWRLTDGSTMDVSTTVYCLPYSAIQEYCASIIRHRRLLV